MRFLARFLILTFTLFGVLSGYADEPPDRSWEAIPPLSRSAHTNSPSATITNNVGLSLGGLCIGKCDQVYVQGSGQIIEHGGGRIIQFGMSSQPRPADVSKFGPLPPLILPLETKGSGVTSALTEIAPGSGVFISTRHSLQGFSYERLNEIFTKHGRSLRDYEAIAFHESGISALDAIMLVPSRSLPSLLDGPDRVKNLFALSIRIQLGWHYFAHQFGERQPGKVAEQYSSGKIIAVDHVHGFVPSENKKTDDLNYSSSGSSGSLAYFLPPQKTADESLRTQWRPGGIIECAIKPYTNSQGHPVAGSTRLIPFRTLLSSRVQRISVLSLTREVRPEVQDVPGACLPTSRRGAGGDGG